MYRMISAGCELLRGVFQFVPPLSLAYIHGAVGLFERASSLCVRTQNRYACGSTCRHIASVEHEHEPIDRLLQ